MSEDKQRVKNRYFAVVKKRTDDNNNISLLDFDTQNELKKALADEDVLEILSITKGRKVSFKETRAIQLTIGE